MSRLRSIVLLMMFLAITASASNFAARSLPDTYTAGGSVNVSISVMTDPSNPPTGVIVVEGLPAGWQIVSSNPEYAKYDEDTNEYRWLRYNTNGVAPFTITYTASVPASATGIKVFNGIMKPGDIPFLGDISISDGSSPPGEPGDINGDGMVDISDVILCLRMVVGLSVTVSGVSHTPPYPSELVNAADMNGDGVVDISDVILILRKSVGL